MLIFANLSMPWLLISITVNFNEKKKFLYFKQKFSTSILETPSGSLPYLEIDGTITTQSLVIFRHLARCFGM